VRIKICPRCGKSVDWIERRKVGDRVYVYAVHVTRTKKGGRVKRKIRKCYLGPADKYEYVSRLHSKEGLEFRGLLDRNRAIAYLDALIKYLENVELNKELRRSLGARFIKLGRKLMSK